MADALTLPDGRFLQAGDDVADRLRCGVMVAEGIEVGDAPAMTAEIDDRAGRLRREHEGRTPGEIEGLQEARRLYRAFGVDPTRTRPSSEALLRRVLKDKPLYRISNAVDACNLASLSFLLPIGLYDLDRVEGSVVLRLGREGEEYPGIRKGAVHLAGRLGLFDAAGPFGSPTSDSARTCVTTGTSRLLAVIMATRGCPATVMRRNIDLLADLVQRHCRGEVVMRALLPRETERP